MMVLLAWILSGILSLSDYFTEVVHIKHKIRNKVLSFAAGVAITYLLLNLLPELYTAVNKSGKYIFLLILLGFTTILLMEKHMYIHKIKKKFRTEHKSMHLTFFFIYNLITGVLIYYFAMKGTQAAMLFFVPFLFYLIVETLPQEFKFRNKKTLLAYSSAPLIGTFLGVTLKPSTIINNILLALITGALLYLIVRESIPPDKKGIPAYFLLGMIFYTIFIMMTWLTY